MTLSADSESHAWCGCLNRKDRYGNVSPCAIAEMWLEDQGEAMTQDRYGPWDQTREKNQTIDLLASERQLLRRLGGELADAVRSSRPTGSVLRALEAWDEATSERKAA